MKHVQSIHAAGEIDDPIDAGIVCHANFLHVFPYRGYPERRHKPLHWTGIDEVSRRKGHRYLAVVYDLERRGLVWVGEDRGAETLARLLFDRFHIVRHLNHAVDESRRHEMRRLSRRER